MCLKYIESWRWTQTESQDACEFFESAAAKEKNAYENGMTNIVMSVCVKIMYTCLSVFCYP